MSHSAYKHKSISTCALNYVQLKACQISFRKAVNARHCYLLLQYNLFNIHFFASSRVEWHWNITVISLKITGREYLGYLFVLLNTTHLHALMPTTIRHAFVDCPKKMWLNCSFFNMILSIIVWMFSSSFLLFKQWVQTEMSTIWL